MFRDAICIQRFTDCGQENIAEIVSDLLKGSLTYGHATALSV
jgi:hypothetical protein